MSKETDNRRCPRCWSVLTPDDDPCPKCGLQGAYQQADVRSQSKKRKPTKKRKLKKTDWLVILALVAIVALLILVNVRQKVAPPATGGTTQSAMQALPPRGSTAGGQSVPLPSASAEQNGPVPTIAAIEETKQDSEMEPGKTYTLDGGGQDVLFIWRQIDMMQLLDKQNGVTAADLLADEKAIEIPEGTRVLLVEALEEMAFVDIVGGSYDGELGYVKIAYLK